MQKKKARLSFMEKIKRMFTFFEVKKEAWKLRREYKRWENGWKWNARFKGKPLTRSMIRRVGSRYRAIELGLIKD